MQSINANRDSRAAAATAADEAVAAVPRDSWVCGEVEQAAEG